MRVQLEENLTNCKALADEYFSSNEIAPEKKMDWIEGYCAQIALLTTQIAWTDDVHKAFDDIEGGMTNAMKICLEGIKTRINLLISKVRLDLTPEMRVKVITIITVDVHSRDTVEDLNLKNVNDKDSFQWLKQLKFYWCKDDQDVTPNQLQRWPWEKD